MNFKSAPPAVVTTLTALSRNWAAPDVVLGSIPMTCQMPFRRSLWHVCGAKLV